MAKKNEAITIQKPNLQILELGIVGTAPYVQHAFGAKAQAEMAAKQAAGSVAKKGAKRKPKDFDQLYEDAMHRASEGWPGIPTSAFRNASISTGKICGLVMTRLKVALFIEADGIDAADGTPLVRITKGEPHQHRGYVRLETGVVDIHIRPMWDPGWEALVRIKFDADMLTASDIANLLDRAGQQVGIGEGRADSKKSNGVGWGFFKLIRTGGDDGENSGADG